MIWTFNCNAGLHGITWDYMELHGIHRNDRISRYAVRIL